MNPKSQALIARTLLGLLLAGIPILTFELSKPNPDYRVLGLALLGGLAAYLDKNFSPQLADTILPGTKMMPTEPKVAAPVLDTLPPTP